MQICQTSDANRSPVPDPTGRRWARCVQPRPLRVGRISDASIPHHPPLVTPRPPSSETRRQCRPSGRILTLEGNQMDELVRLDNVTRTFPMGRTTVTALDDISLAVGRGEFVAVAGPSGSGKSTLLHLIGCLDRPTSGSIHIDGVDTSALKPAQFARLRREQHRLRFSDLQPDPGVHGRRERRISAVDTRRSAPGAPPPGARGSRRRGPRAARRPPARPAVGRRAAARRGGARDRSPAAPGNRRRADRQPRYAERHRSRRNHARASTAISA